MSTQRGLHVDTTTLKTLLYDSFDHSDPIKNIWVSVYMKLIVSLNGIKDNDFKDTETGFRVYKSRLLELDI